MATEEEDFKRKIEHLSDVLDDMLDKMNDIEANTVFLERELRQELEELRREIKSDR